MNPGDRMVRLEDGMAGVVEAITLQNPVVNGVMTLEHRTENRIVFQLHGERLIAGKQEKWVPADPGPLPLRESEKIQVAMVADRYLRSIVRHEPLRWWEPLDPTDPGPSADHFDAQLVKVIVDYLGTRK